MTLLPTIMIAVTMSSAFAAPPAGQVAGSEVSIPVLVVDASGVPVSGVPVALFGGSDDDPFGWSGSTATSNATGTATLALDRRELDTRFPPSVWLHFLHEEGVHVAVPEAFIGAADGDGTTGTRDATAPVRLVLPPTVALELSIVDERGARIEGIGEIALNLRAREPRLLDEEMRLGKTVCHAQTVARDGRAWLPFVGASARIAVSGFGTIGGRQLRSADLGGLDALPITIVEGRPTVCVTVPAEPAGLRLLGRLLEPDGTPAARVRFRVRHWIEDGGSSVSSCKIRNSVDKLPLRGEFTTDERGRFSFEVPAPPPDLPDDDPPPSDFVVLLGVANQNGALDRGTAIRVESRLWDDPDRRVGDRTLVRTQFVASGRLFDDRGEPMGATHFSIQPATRPESADPVETPADFRQKPPAESLLHWLDPHDDDHEFGPTTDADGRFELRRFGWPANGALELRPAVAVTSAATLPIGTRDVHLAFTRCGSIHAELLLPEGVALAQIKVAATATAIDVDGDIRGKQRSVWHGRLQPAAKLGPVEMTVAPGEWTLTVEVPELIPGPVELLRTGPFKIAPGERCLDPRATTLDLRSRIVVRELQVLDDGQPVSRGRAIVHWRGDPKPGERERNFDRNAEFPIVGGRCRMLASAGSEADLSVELSTSGRAPLRTSWIALPETVDLAQVVVRFTFDSDDPAAPLAKLPAFVIRFWQDPPAGSSAEAENTAPPIELPVPRAGDLAVTFARPGRWNYALSFRNRDHVLQRVPPPISDAPWGSLELLDLRHTCWKLSLTMSQARAVIAAMRG